MAEMKCRDSRSTVIVAVRGRNHLEIPQFVMVPVSARCWSWLY